MDVKRIYFKNQYNLKAQIAFLVNGRYCLSRYSYPDRTMNNKMFDQRITHTLEEAVAILKDIYTEDMTMFECTYDEFIETFTPVHHTIEFVCDDGIMETYENVFMVTETHNNGKESRHRKSVFTPVFDHEGKHITEDRRIEACTALLQDYGYYKIEYIETKCPTMMAVDF